MTYNSAKNQEIKQQLVTREIITNASQMMQELSKTLGDNEDYLNIVVGYDYETPVIDYIENEMSNVEAMQYLVNDNGSMPGTGSAKSQLLKYVELSQYPEDYEEFALEFDIEPDTKEPLEFWIVTDYFGKRLQEKGEIVGEFMGFTIWGRCTSGQAIMLDCVISEIAKDMEILEGMANSWA